MIRYVAIFEQINGDKFIIEYRPCYDEIAGGIEIFSVDFQPRPRSPFEIREEDRRAHPRKFVANNRIMADETIQPLLWEV